MALLVEKSCQNSMDLETSCFSRKKLSNLYFLKVEISSGLHLFSYTSLVNRIFTPHKNSTSEYDEHLLEISNVCIYVDVYHCCCRLLVRTYIVFPRMESFSIRHKSQVRTIDLLILTLLTVRRQCIIASLYGSIYPDYQCSFNIKMLGIFDP